jgi:hypothetical protein
MKFREGFVSNSSTTSFMVAIPESVSKSDEPYIALFEKIVEKLKVEDSDFGYGFVIPKDLIKDYDEKIKNCGDEIKLYEHFYNQVAEFMGNKTHQSAVQLFLDIVEKSKGLEYLRHFTPKKQLSELQSDTQDYIKDLNKKIIDLEKKREQVIISSKDAKYIMTFKMDHWRSDLDGVLVSLIDAGLVKLVRREDT